MALARVPRADWRVSVSQESKQAILQPLSILRPKFRAVAQSLTDLVRPPYTAPRFHGNEPT